MDAQRSKWSMRLERDEALCTVINVSQIIDLISNGRFIFRVPEQAKENQQNRISKQEDWERLYHRPPT